MGAKEQYERVDFNVSPGIVPYSIWSLRGKEASQYRKEVEALVDERGDKSTRLGTAKYFGGAGEKTKFTATTSYYHPFLARTILRAYSNEGDRVFDPFSSIVRPVVAALEKRHYVGCEIRDDEIAATNAVLSKIEGASSKVLKQDSRTFVNQEEPFDLVFTCPPYWNHEKYSDQEDDLSNIASYENFLTEFAKVAAVSYTVLRPGAFCVLTVADFRDYSEGRRNVNRLVPFVADTINVFEDAAFQLYDQVVVEKPLGTAPARLKLWNNRKTVRVHETLLVFLKGNKPILKRG